MSQPEMPGLLYSEAENDLRQTVRAFFTERLRPADVLARTESGEPYDLGLWHALAADLGCGGLLVPEPAGGAGASYREAAVATTALPRNGTGATKLPSTSAAAAASR